MQKISLVRMLLFVILCMLIGALAVFLNYKLLLMIVIGATISSFCMINPKRGVLLLLLIRSSLDMFSNYFFFIDGLNISSIISILLIFITFTLILLKKIKLNNNNIVNYFAIFICIGLISLILPGNYLMGVLDWSKFISMLSMFYLINYLCIEDNEFIKEVIKTIVFSSIIPLIIGIHQIISGNLFKSSLGMERVNATFVHPNPFAFYLIIIISCTYIYIYEYCKKYKFLFIFIIMTSFIELYYTYTRGAWIGIAIMIILTIAFDKSKQKYKYLIGLLILSYPIYRLTSGRFQNVFSYKREESSLATRLYIWSSMIKFTSESPILGKGLGSFKFYTNQIMGWGIEAHNDYIKLLFEVGIIGLVSYIGLMFATLKKIFTENSVLSNRSKIIIFNLFASFCIMSFADNIIDMTISQWYLWTLVAISMVKLDANVN